MENSCLTAELEQDGQKKNTDILHFPVTEDTRW